ncbi:MAG TPA: undecaprenyl-phosphate glucose phosphotransferase [Gammaproteobacteria bacterium]|nr:undecaprenyl-phosphate glucose phosphotransferase [Gammaproteobacteria bacterium]
MDVSQGGIIRPFGPVLDSLFRLTDWLIIAGVFLFFVWLYQLSWLDAYTIALSIALLIFVFGSEILALYRSWRVSSLGSELSRVWLLWLFVGLGLLLLAYATKTSSVYSRRLMLSWLIATPATLSLVRIIIRELLKYLRARGFNSRSAVVVGDGEVFSYVRDTILGSPGMGVDLKAVIDWQAGGNQDFYAMIDSLVKRARQGGVDLIYIALPAEQAALVRELVSKLSDSTASVFVVPDLFMFDLLTSRWSKLGSVPVIGVREDPFWGAAGLAKRAEDLVLSSVILMVVALPMMLIAIAIKLTSPGPILFKQHRYGLDGKEIEVWKFRTMSVCEDGAEVPQAKKNDPRITKLGAWLRRTSLDELPQFLNVLQGNMSVVGPRPHAIAHNEIYRPQIYGYMSRHKVKPGITGWAQVNGWRGETDTIEKMEKRVEHDMAYICNWSLALDLKIVLLTMFKGFSGKNAF